jgi:hypothetical protein
LNENQNDEDINDIRTRSKTDEIESDQDKNTSNDDDENISNDLRTRSKNDDDSNHEEDISNDLWTRSKINDDEDIWNDDDESFISEKENTSSLLTMIKEIFEQNNTLIKIKQRKKQKKENSHRKHLRTNSNCSWKIWLSRTICYI